MAAVVYHDYSGKAEVRYCIDEFAALVHPRNGHPKIFAMIDAYLDESGIHDDAPVCVVAGYFGGRGQWKKFEIEWRKALEDAEIPLGKFHAKNLIKREGFFKEFFKDWTDEEHSQFLAELASIICRYKIYPVSQAVIVTDFNALTMGEKRALTGGTVRENGTLLTTGCPSKPYFVPFQYAVRNICTYAPVGGKAHFFFGLDRPFAEYASYLFKYIKENVDMPNKERLGDPSFPLAKETPQLQAADYFAYLTYKHGLERLSDGNWLAPPAKQLNDLAQRARDRTTDFIFFDAECMRKMLVRDLTPEAYETLRRFQ